MLAVLIAIPVAQAALAQPELPPLTQANYWQSNVTTGSYGTFPLYPSGNVAGYKFTVNKKTDGSLPFTHANAAGAIADQTAPLYKKINATQYVIYYPQFGLGYLGLLLPAGEYVLATRPQAGIPGYQAPWNPAEHYWQALIAGQWMSAEEQNKLWIVPSYSNTYITVQTQTGRTVKGYKFTITAGPNGELPAVQYNFMQLNNSNGPILKRMNATQWAYFSSGFGYGRGLLLRPGDYLVEFEPEEGLTQDHYRFAKILQGYWMTP